MNHTLFNKKILAPPGVWYGYGMKELKEPVGP